MNDIKVISDIHKRFGQGSIFTQKDKAIDISAIPTGSLALDLALGVGGLPRGRIVEIYGPESTGKSTLCQHIVAEVQKMDELAAFIDVEQSLDPAYAETCGVNLETLYISQPDSAEQALEICEMLVRSGDFSLVVVDSVALLVPRAEIEGDMGDSHMGVKARLMGQALRKIQPVAKEKNCTVLFTNQLRQKLGVMFGNPETTPGGDALKYSASIRLDMRKGQQIKDKDEIIGNEVRVTVKKNKVAPPFKVVNLNIYFDEGISKLTDIINLSIEAGLIEKSGAWFTFENEKFQGMNNLREVLKGSLGLKLENQLRLKYGLPIIQSF
jgi:recombination protein RecA